MAKKTIENQKDQSKWRFLYRKETSHGQNTQWGNSLGKNWTIKPKNRLPHWNASEGLKIEQEKK